MTNEISRREFVVGAAAAGLGAGTSRSAHGRAPSMHAPRAVNPLVIADLSGLLYKNGGPHSAVERAFASMTGGRDLLDALIDGVNIPELDPEETGIGYGGLPNADGVVQLDACCMHGPKRWAGAVAALEGVRTPSLVAKAVMEHTDHHLLVGRGAQEFARGLGFVIEDDLNTERSRHLWLEWKRRIDPGHWLDPEKRGRHGYDVGMAMVNEGLIPAASFWGTINCNGINARGEICGVTTTSGLSFKIPGRTGDSPILGAGLYVDNEVGAAGSTGRGEANLYNLSSYLIVEHMRRGLHPKDAGMEALKRMRANTVEPRLLNPRGLPNFDVRFFILNKKGEYAGVALYGWSEKEHAICGENGAERVPFATLLEGSPSD